eukprot:546926_1
MLANRVYREFKKIKEEQVKKATSKAAAKVGYIPPPDEHEQKGFELQLFGQSKYWKVPQKVNANTSVRRVKELYKAESGVGTNIDDIYLISKAKVLPGAGHATLGQCGIVNERHLITVKFKAHTTVIKNWRGKKVKKWSNKDLCDWIKSIGLSDKWQDTMIQAIENTGCTGQDWFAVKNGKDLANSFDIKQPMLANRVYREFKKIKEEQVKKATSKAAAKVGYIPPPDEHEQKGFELQLFGQ